MTLTVGEVGSTFQRTVYAGKENDSCSFEVLAFAEFSDYAEYESTDTYDIVKYPTDITHAFEIVPVGSIDYYNLKKQTASASVVMAIPKVFSKGIDGSRYSNSDHVIRDLNIISSQLTLDSQLYYFDLYYDNGYFKVTIRSGSSAFYTYEADK